MKNNTFIIIAIIMAVLLLGSCNMPTPQQRPGDPTPDLNLILTQAAQMLPTATVPETEPTPEPSPTPEKVETLAVCLGKEPATLFFYDESSQAMWTVLESIYDGPFDTGNGEAVPVIFNEITITEEPVSIQRGDIITDIQGEAVEVKPGTQFFTTELPFGCSGNTCVTTWTAVTESEVIPQTVITFRLKENLTWSDGTPLTAEDSVYSMSVNGMKDINASKRIYNLTESYKALDEHTVEWRGLPGYSPDDPSDVFWTPLPSHVMKGMSVDMLRESEEVTTTPLGWGAWQIVSWDKGNEIIAERNPYYQSANGAEPFFDRIVYKFYGRAGDNNLQALASGSCDIIDTSVDLGYDLEPVLEDVRDGKESIYISPALTRQEMVLNFDSLSSTAIDLFSDPRIRTAITQCIDRTALIRQVLYGQSEIPVDFFPQNHIRHNTALEAIAYDTETARQTLDELGWTVPDEDPEGIRQATQVLGIPYGTELSFTLNTSDSTNAKKAAGMIKDNLAQCGIAVQVESLPIEDLYAQGPSGIIFGRKFDAAMFSWSAGRQPCTLYLSDGIPDETNHWVGTNVGSYRNESYDEACLLPKLTETDAGQLYAEKIPAIPLYFNISIAVSANNICGIDNRIGSRSILWNVEQLSRSDDRCAVSQWNNIYQ